MSGTRLVVVSLLVLSPMCAAQVGENYVPVLSWGSTGTGDGQFDRPEGIAMDSRGNIYVTDVNNHRIQKFTSSGKFLGKWGSLGSGDGQFDIPWAIAIDPSNDRVYVIDFHNARIQKFRSDGTFVLKWGTRGRGDGQFENPSALAVDAFGNVYVTDGGSGKIQKFTSSGAFLTTWQSVPRSTGFSGPSGIALDRQGRVLVADREHSALQKFTRNGTFLAWWGDTGAFSVAVAPAKHTYLGLDGRIYKLDPNGNTLASWAAGDPDKLVADAAGAVYTPAGQFADHVVKYAPVPMLDWAGTPRFENYGLWPIAGDTSERYVFKVKYTDPSGAPVKYCRAVVQLRVSNGPYGVAAPGPLAVKKVEMKKVSGSVRSGRIYKAEVQLPYGWHGHHFEAANIHGPATGRPTDLGWHGPAVNHARQSRPDALVYDGWVWFGDNIYNTTGQGQRMVKDVVRGGKAVYKIKVQNDRDAEDTLLAKGPGSTSKWRLTYLTAAGADITSAVTGSGWSTPSLAAGKAARIKLRMQPLSGAGVGNAKAALVRVGRASWGPTKYAEQADAVKCVSTMVSDTSGTLQLAGLAALPTATGAQVSFSLSSPASVQARVLNIAGRPVKTLCTARDCEAGANTLLWNATSDQGTTVPNGMYLVEVTARGEDGSQARALAAVSVGR